MSTGLRTNTKKLTAGRTWLTAWLMLFFFAGIYSLPCARSCTYTIPPLPDATLIIEPALFGYMLAPGDTICLSGGSYRQILIRNLEGTGDAPIVIRNTQGQAIISNQSFYGIAIHNCVHLRILGDGDPGIAHGIWINGVSAGNGISADRKSSHIEIARVEVGHVGMSGIMMKTDPSCDDLSAVRDSFTMREIRVRDCYIHHIVNEGIYVGSSFYTGFPLNCQGQDTLVMPHEVIGVEISNNFLFRTGRNSVQISSAVDDCLIYGNTILEDSQLGINFHMNGIQVGGGSRCAVYNNRIIDGKGGGIHYFGRGPGSIFNNLIVRPGRTHHPELPANQYPVHGIMVRHVFTDTNDPIHVAHNTIIDPKTDGIQFLNPYTAQNRIQNNLIVNPGAFPYVGQDSFIRIVTESIHPFLISHNFFSLSFDQVKFSDTLTLEFELSMLSPAVNAGIDLSSLGMGFDIRNRPRPFGPASDIGAFELQHLVPVFPQDESLKLWLYPNPVSDLLYMVFPHGDPPSQGRLYIYDAVGRLVLTNDRLAAALKQGVYTGSLRPGVYRLVLREGSRTI